MENAYYELQWPREKLYVSCYAHEVMNYRYHWHQDDYEMSILLHGSQEYCWGHTTAVLAEDDVLLIGPGVGHASFAPEANTRALVLHFSAAAFKPYVKKGFLYRFSDCRSGPEDRQKPRYCRLRFYASQIYDAAQKAGPFAQLTAKASLELLLATLCESFDPQAEKALPERDDPHREIISRLIAYIEENYAEKLSLEDLASFSQYNRTYLSTLFKNTVGINFYEYLTRVRFHHALIDLAVSSKSLTDVALENGFSDLKSFNAKCREILGRSPAEYRAQLAPGRVMLQSGLNLLSGQDPILQRKLREYLRLPDGAASTDLSP